MSQLLLLLIIILVVIGIIGAYYAFGIFLSDIYSEPPKKKELKEAEKINYYKNKYFLTDAEKNFFFTLKPIADKHSWLICPKVRLLDLFYVPKHEHSKRARVIQKHIDFVLCSSDTVSPLCAIELDDRSHEQTDRIKRDDFVNQVFHSAKLPLIRIKNSYHYNQEYIEATIVSKISQYKGM